MARRSGPRRHGGRRLARRPNDHNARPRPRKVTDPARGFDPLAQGGRRFSGAIPMRKGVDGTKLLFYTSYHEFVAALVALVHPLIAQLGRGDVSDDAAQLRGITGPSGPRLVVQALLDEAVLTYLPDYDARTLASAQIIVEAGRVRQKASRLELAKLSAAAVLARLSGGELWVIDSDLIPRAWVRNAVVLYLRTFDPAPPELAEQIRDIWQHGHASIKWIVGQFASEYAAETIEAAAFTVAGQLFCEGRLAGPISEETLSLATTLGAVPAARPPVEPPGIIRDLEELVRVAGELGGPIEPGAEAEDDGDTKTVDIDAADVDPDRLSPRQREAYLRVLEAIREYDECGGGAAAVARRHGLEERSFQRAIKARAKYGIRSLVPYGRARGGGGSRLDSRMVALIEDLYVGPERLSIAAIVEHAKVRRLADDLDMERSPGRFAVAKVIERLMRREHKARSARAGKDSLPPAMYGRSIPTNGPAGLYTEVDEAWVDVVALAFDGEEVTVRLHIGVLICIATRTLLAVVISPKTLDQWDYRRLLLRAFLPKDQLAKRHGIKTEWPAGMLYIVRADRGKIETAQLVFEAAAGLPIIVEFAPIRDPHAKPFVEAANNVMQRLFEHRLKITTKSSPYHRGAHDPVLEAIRGQIDVDRVETALMRWIADVYHNRTHGGLRARPLAVWERRVAEFGLRRWLRPPDDLRSLLKRDAGPALVTNSGITYNGTWYGAGVLEHLWNTSLWRRVDDDDVRTIEVYDEFGNFVAVIKNDKLAEWPRPISTWELTLARQVARKTQSEGDEPALDENDLIHQELASPTDEARARRRRRYQADRAEEVATQAMAELVAGPTEAPPPANNPKRIPSVLTPPEAEDDDDREPLPIETDMEGSYDDAA
jgi:hypothetical protein